MRKSKPVIILLSIQLVLALMLTLVNPIEDHIIRSKGTEYTFEISEAACYGNFIDKVDISVKIKNDFGFSNVYLTPGQYAIITTNENGLSRLSHTSDTRPESDAYIGTAGDKYYYFTEHQQTIDIEVFRLGADMEPPLFDLAKDVSTKNYEITAKIYVYKGKALLNEILVNGVEIEDFLKNQ